MPGRLIPRILVVFTRQLEILVTTLVKRNTTATLSVVNCSLFDVFPGYVYDWTLFKKVAIDELQVCSV